MAEHENVGHKNKDGIEQKHRHGQKDSQPLSDYFHTWDEGYISIGETPFQPQVEKHKALLTMARSDEQRANITLQLQQSYGNNYVQRVVDLVQAKSKYELSDQKFTMTQLGKNKSVRSTTLSRTEWIYPNSVETPEELQASEATEVVEKSHRIQAQPEKGAEKPQTIQSIYRFEVCFVFDTLGRAKLTVGRAEEKADIGVEEVKPKVKPQVINSYGYSHGFHWAWESSAAWESGKLVEVEEAVEAAHKAIKSAHDSINNSSLDENERKAAHDDLDFIDLQIAFFFNIEALVSRKPVISERDLDAAKKAEEESYKSGMNTGPFTSIEFLEDKITYKPGGGGPAATKEPEIPIGKEKYTVYFGPNKDTLSSDAQSELTKLISLLQAPDVKAKIVGHASTEGRPKHNLDLSQRRADSVENYLKQQGVAPDKLQFEAKGETEPAVEEKTKADRAKNRRVEIEITHK